MMSNPSTFYQGRVVTISPGAGPHFVRLARLPVSATPPWAASLVRLCAIWPLAATCEDLMQLSWPLAAACEALFFGAQCIIETERLPFLLIDRCFARRRLGPGEAYKYSDIFISIMC